MSIYTNLTWPVQDVEAVCKTQNVLTPGPLLLNGTLFDANIPDQVSFARKNLVRSISLTSVNNLLGANFVISGFQNGAYVTETLVGPNNNTVYGAKYYDIIISIVSSAAVNGIQAGTGGTGFLPLIMINPNAGFINYSMSVKLATPGINYSIFQTLDQVSQNFITFQDQIMSFFPYIDQQHPSGIISQTASITSNSTIITNFILLKINSSATPITDTLKFIFLQE